METSESQTERVGLIVLAAGQGTRMRSALPKPFHTVAGIPMLERVLRAGTGAKPCQTAVVFSPESVSHLGALTDTLEFTTVIQDPPRGTGDAVRRALEALADVDLAVVLYSDHPLLEPKSVARLVQGARESQSKVTILSAVLDDPAGFGRVERDDAGRVARIVERRDDTTSRSGPTEINSGMMVVDADWATSALRETPPSAATGEVYLTSLVDLAAQEAEPDRPWPVVAIAGDPDDALGVNDRLDLARAEARAWERKREWLMLSGVTMRLPETIVVDEDVVIGPDTVILPHTAVHGSTEIGGGCIIGPASFIQDSRIGERVIVRLSVVESCQIADDADVGPYSHLRAGCEIGPRSHVGNFAELKNAKLAGGVKVGHFSYIGDASLGAETNVGAGTVTANFDGIRKHQTTIGSRAFIGSDTVLRAPVRVGDDARTGAGAVVTKDVPDGATVVGVPARMVRRNSVGTQQIPEEV